MKNRKIIWTFLDDEIQQAFYDLQGRLSDEGKKVIEDKVRSKIDQKGKPVVGVTQVRIEGDKFVLVGTFGECSIPNTFLKELEDQ